MKELDAIRFPPQKPDRSRNRSHESWSSEVELQNPPRLLNEYTTVDPIGIRENRTLTRHFVRFLLLVSRMEDTSSCGPDPSESCGQSPRTETFRRRCRCRRAVRKTSGLPLLAVHLWRWRRATYAGTGDFYEPLFSVLAWSW